MFSKKGRYIVFQIPVKNVAWQVEQGQAPLLPSQAPAAGCAPLKKRRDPRDKKQSIYGIFMNKIGSLWNVEHLLLSGKRFLLGIMIGDVDLTGGGRSSASSFHSHYRAALGGFRTEHFPWKNLRRLWHLGRTLWANFFEGWAALGGQHASLPATEGEGARHPVIDGHGSIVWHEDYFPAPSIPTYFTLERTLSVAFKFTFKHKNSQFGNQVIL